MRNEFDDTFQNKDLFANDRLHPSIFFYIFDIFLMQIACKS